MKIDDDWLIFCPVSLRGKTLEMATSTIPWQSSAYSFLRDERERIRYPDKTNQQNPGQFICRKVFSLQDLQDPIPITRSFRVANRRAASLPPPPCLHQQIPSFSVVIIPSIAPFHKGPQTPLSTFTVRSGF